MSTKNSNGTTLTPPGIYELQNDDTTLLPLTAPKPTFTTPADQGIAPTQGDDTTPPNTLKKGKLNAIVAQLLANVGFSTSNSREWTKRLIIDKIILIIFVKKELVILNRLYHYTDALLFKLAGEYNCER
jgi:hypothetical protein